MRNFRALAVTIAMFAFAPSAQSQVFDVSKISCKDFVAIEKDHLVMVWSWIYGYYAADDADPVIDLKEITRKGTKLVEYCTANPAVDIITAAEPIYEKK